jgi:hypothetical protein
MSDEKPLPEDDGTDPLSLSNLILNKDMRKTGFNWTHYGPSRPKSAEETLVTEPIANASVTPGVFVQEEVAEAMVAPQSAATAPVASQSAANTGGAAPTMGIEANNLNPAIVSSDPKFNPCPAYLQSMCRIDGRPCPYSVIDYKECGKYYLAGSGDPELFEISPGREQSPEYQQGIKA